MNDPSGLTPAAWRKDDPGGDTISTHRRVDVYAYGAWRFGIVRAWHRDSRGWRCLLDYTAGVDRHYCSWVRCDPGRIIPC